MSKIKIITVEGKTTKERARLIEETQNINENIVCKGPVYYEDEGDYSPRVYCADIYFIKGDTEIKELSQENIIREEKEVSPDTSSSKKQFKIDEATLERWKKIKPTKGTKDLLKKKGYSDEELKYIKTQYDAHKILESLKRENI